MPSLFKFLCNKVEPGLRLVCGSWILMPWNSHYVADFPVVIVGAGPVGLTLALGLAKQGIRSLILDKKERLDEHSRALIVVARTLEVLESYGLAKAFLREGYFLRQLTLHDVDRREIVFELSFHEITRETFYSGMLVLPQDRLERMILDQVLATGLCDVRFGHQLVSYKDYADHVDVSFNDNCGLLSTAGASFLVGCDGAHSTVRRLTGQELKGTTFPIRVFLCDIKIADSLRDQLPFPRLQVSRSGLVGAIRYKPFHWRLLGPISANEKEDEAVSRARMSTLVSELLGPGTFDQLWAGVFSVHSRMAPSFRKGRILLAGDAAHISSPAGGQGMNSGMQDAHNLAWKLGCALNGGDTEQLLSSYDQERRSAITSFVLPFTTSLTRVALHPRLIPTALRLVRYVLQSRSFQRAAGRRLGMLGMRYKSSSLVFGEPKWAGRPAPGSGRSGLTLFCFGGSVLRVRELQELTISLQREYRLPPIAIRNVEQTESLWVQWQARPNLLAFVRPDGYVGWAAINPTRAETSSAVRRALGQQMLDKSPSVSQSMPDPV